MFVVTVNFVIKQAHIAAFRSVMEKQAFNSLHHEEGCVQFDVCYDPLDDRRVFLYEVYTSKEAFAVHLETDHFLSFRRNVEDWVEEKVDHQWERVETIG